MGALLVISRCRQMADFLAKASSPTPVGDPRLEGADAAATVEFPVAHSSASSPMRSSHVNQESGTAQDIPENINVDSVEPRAVEDDALQLQEPQVWPRTILSGGSSSVDRPEEVVTHDSMSAHGDISEATAAASSALSAASLLTLLKLMLLCGSGGPVPSRSDQPPVEVTKGLLFYAAEAVRELFLTHEEQIHLACGMLDEREALAYLIGDVTGIGLITAESARKAGDKAGKLVWVRKGQPPIEKELADARRAVQRRAGKLPAGASIETEFEDARAAVLRRAVELPLVKRSAERARPRPLLPPPPPPPPAELDPRLVRWCRNQGGTNADPRTIVQCVSRGRYERQKRHRAWHPIACSEQSELAAKLARREACDDLCTCAQGTPSFLCHVNVCFATAAGSRCEERRLPVEDCDCMGWQYDGGGGRDQNTCPYRITPPLDPDRHLLDEYSMQYMMRWQPPYSLLSLRAAGLCSIRVRRSVPLSVPSRSAGLGMLRGACSRILLCVCERGSQRQVSNSG